MNAPLRKLPFYNQLMLPYHFFQSLSAALKYHFPARDLTVIAVTGTNGKTTTSFMIWQMLRHTGFPAGLMTTVAWGADQLQPELNHMTTVDPFTLNSRITDLKRQGVEFLVLEVTSHALAQFRILGIPIDIAVFTNLTHDHLDYHKTFAKYRAAKGKLFKKAEFSVLNMDDPASEYYEQLSKDYITYGIKFGEIRAKSVKLSINGVKYSFHDIKSEKSAHASSSSSRRSSASSRRSSSHRTAPLNLAAKSSDRSAFVIPAPSSGSSDFTIETQIPGEFNVYNSLAAAVVGRQLGLTPYQIATGIKSLKSVEGRMNIIDLGQPFTVIVDYAHAPDALEKVFASVKNHRGRIISVHGGAGRRDPTTRPIRGRILAENSDVVIITEDDSRDEPLDTIMDAFIAGAEEKGKVLGKDLFKIPNRRDAIELALKTARAGDLVLLLGKGHEKTILRSDGPHNFNDATVAKTLLKKLGY